jgi:thiol-disulfide isomerase/thioredoxin
VVDFSAPGWCVPCRRLAPHFRKAAETSSAVFVEIDIDNADEAIRQKYDIQSVPTVILFEDGEQVKLITGRTVMQILQEIA